MNFIGTNSQCCRVAFTVDIVLDLLNVRQGKYCTDKLEFCEMLPQRQVREFGEVFDDCTDFSIELKASKLLRKGNKRSQLETEIEHEKNPKKLTLLKLHLKMLLYILVDISLINATRSESKFLVVSCFLKALTILEKWIRNCCI